MAHTPIPQLTNSRNIIAQIEELTEQVLHGVGTINDLVIGDSSDTIILTLDPIKGDEQAFRGAVADLFEDLTTPQGTATEAPVQAATNAPEFTASGRARIAINGVNPELLNELVQSMSPATATAVHEVPPPVDLHRVCEVLNTLNFGDIFYMGNNNVDEQIPFRFGEWNVSNNGERDMAIIRIDVDQVYGAVAGEVQAIVEGLNNGLDNVFPDKPVAFTGSLGSEEPPCFFILEARHINQQGLEAEISKVGDVAREVAAEVRPNVKDVYQSMDQEKLAVVQERNFNIYTASVRRARERAEATGEEFDLGKFREDYLKEFKGKNRASPEL